MSDEKIEIFTMQLRDKKSKEPIKFEGDFLESIYDMFNLKFPNHINDFPPDRLKTITSKVEKVIKDGKEKSIWVGSRNKHRIAGVLSLGRDRDKVLKFTNPKKEKKAAGEKRKGLTIDKPFYFDLIFSENKKTGFVVFQRTEGKSCKAQFTTLAQSLLDRYNGNLKFILDSYIENEFFENYLKDGEYNEIEFIKYGVETDTLIKYLGDYAQKGNYIMSTIIKAKKEQDFSERLKKVIYSKYENGESFFSIPNMGVNVNKGKQDVMKITSTYNGKKRKIDLSNTLKIQPYYILENLKLNDDGFVDFESIRKKTSSLLIELNIDIL